MPSSSVADPAGNAQPVPSAAPGIEAPVPGTSRLIRSVLIFSLAGVLLYGAATMAGDYHLVIAALLRFPLPILGLIMLLVFAGWLLRGWRFYYYLRQTGEPVPFGYSLAAFLAGFALTGTPGKVGEAVKGVFLKKDYGVPVTKVVGILVVERLMDLWGILLLGSFSLLLFEGWRRLFLLCAGVVVAGGLFLCMESIYRPVLERLARLSFLEWVCKKMLSVLLTGRELMSPRIFLVGLVVSSASWSMESLSLYLMMRGFELPGSLLQANFVYCFSQILGALSMLPGGIGGAEAGMIGLFSFMGISYSEGLPVVILIRICTLWAAVIVGVGFMLFMLGRSHNAAGKLKNPDRG